MGRGKNMGKKNYYSNSIKKKNEYKNKSRNPYFDLLVRLYTFLQRHVPTRFNRTLIKRLLLRRRNRPQLSIGAICRLMLKKRGTAVVVATVTDDKRRKTIPRGLKICALRFTESARAKMISANGKCISFDQLSLLSPKGYGCNLFRGRKPTTRKSGSSGRGTSLCRKIMKPKIGSFGRKLEIGRGRRNSKGFRL